MAPATAAVAVGAPTPVDLDGDGRSTGAETRMLDVTMTSNAI